MSKRRDFSAVEISTTWLHITYHPILHCTGSKVFPCLRDEMGLDSKSRMKLLPQVYLHTYKHTADQNSNQIPKIRPDGQGKSGHRRLNVHGTFGLSSGSTRADLVRRPRCEALLQPFHSTHTPGLEAEKDRPRSVRKLHRIRANLPVMLLVPKRP